MADQLAEDSPAKVPSDIQDVFKPGEELAFEFRAPRIVPHVKTVFAQMTRVSRANLSKFEATHISNNPWFNTFFSFLILMYMVSLGVETSLHLRGTSLRDRREFFFVDVFFLVAFLVEFCLRLSVRGWEYFDNMWNYFDYVVVLIGLAQVSVAIAGTGDPANVMEVSATLRIARLLRVVQTIQDARALFKLWQVIRGFLDALRMTFWVSMFFIIVVHFASVMVTMALARNTDVIEFWPESQMYFGSVWASYLTMSQISTFDNWIQVMRPLCEVSWLGATLMFFASALIGLGICSIMVGVMVESTIQNKKNSRERQKQITLGNAEPDKIILAKLLHEFLDITDGRREMTMDEFRRLLARQHVVLFLKALSISPEQADELFFLLDSDNDGTLCVAEYLVGLDRLKGLARGEDLVAFISFAKRQCANANSCLFRLRQLRAKADRITDRLKEVGVLCSNELRYRNLQAEAYEKAQSIAQTTSNFIKCLDDVQASYYPRLVLAST